MSYSTAGIIYNNVIMHYYEPQADILLANDCQCIRRQFEESVFSSQCADFLALLEICSILGHEFLFDF